MRQKVGNIGGHRLKKRRKGKILGGNYPQPNFKRDHLKKYSFGDFPGIPLGGQKFLFSMS